MGSYPNSCGIAAQVQYPSLLSEDKIRLHQVCVLRSVPRIQKQLPTLLPKGFSTTLGVGPGTELLPPVATQQSPVGRNCDCPVFVLTAPVPKRQKCDHWSPCPPDTYAYRLLSGGGLDKYAKICFEDEM